MNLLRRFWSLVSGSSYTVKRASALLAVAALLSNVLGLLRNLVFYRLVDPAQLDVYYASFRVPDLLFNVVLFGAMSTAFVPVVTELFAGDREKDAYHLTDEVLSWLTVCFVGLAIILAIFMRPLMEVVVPGFNPERLAQSVTISRVILVQSIFFAWSFVVGSFLNSRKRFATYALAPLVYNLALILGGFAAARFGIMAIAVAVVLGAMAHFGIQFGEMLRTTYRPRFRLTFSKEMREVTTLMIPRSLSQSTGQIVLLVYTTLASTLTAGSIAVYSGMNDLQTTPVVIVANSVAVAFFPVISTYIAQKNWEELNNLLHKVLRAILFILLPSLALIFILRAQIVRLYFGIGGANWDLTALAINTFVAFMAGIIPAALVTIFSRLFYALKDTWRPMIYGTIAAAVSIVWAVVSIGSGKGTVVNLAIATSILSGTQCILYLYAFYRHTEIKLGLRRLWPYIIKYSATSIVMAAGVWISLRLVDRFYQSTGFLGTRVVLGLFLQLCIGLIVGGIIFLQYSKRVHVEEMAWIKSRRFTNEK